MYRDEARLHPQVFLPEMWDGNAWLLRDAYRVLYAVNSWPGKYPDARPLNLRRADITAMHIDSAPLKSLGDPC